MEASWFCRLCSPTRAHHHPLHWLPSSHFLLLRNVFGGERRGRFDRELPVCKFCPRPLVGPDHAVHSGLRRHSAADVEGEDDRLLLRHVRHLLLCSSCWYSWLWLCLESPGMKSMVLKCNICQNLNLVVQLWLQQQQRQKHMIRRRGPAATLIQSLWRCYASVCIAQ